MQLKTAALNDTTLSRWVFQEASKINVALGVKGTVIFRDRELSRLKTVLSRH